MSDFLDSLGDVAQGAYDFLMPQTQRHDQGLSLGNMINSLGEAIQTSPVGALTKIPDLINSDAGWGEKLLLSGALAAGGFMSARHYFGAAKVERELAEAASRDAVLAARPVRDPAGLRIGLPQRYAPSTVEGEAILRQWPGLKPRTADILGAKDFKATAFHLTELADDTQLERAGAILDTYSARLADVDPAQRLGAAQGDWAKMHMALDSRLIAGSRNDDLVKLWKKFSTAPSSLADDEVVRLQDYVQQLGDVTRGIIEPDMSFDVASKVSQIDMTEFGPVIHVSTPVGWDDGLSLDPKVRSDRLKMLNVRQLTGRAERILKYLYQEGINDGERYLERTDDWYRNVHEELIARLDELSTRVPPGMQTNLEKFAAAVSLTSEATDWDQNIDMAITALEQLSKEPAFQRPDFQEWLRATSGAKEGDGSEYQRIFDRVHDEVTNRPARDAYNEMKKARLAEWKAIPKKQRPTWENFFTEPAPEGNFLSAADLKKVLRLFTESGEDVFATMGGPKQKNFYLNMLYPELDDPVTVDRHAYDIFFGVATHSDFKGLELKSFGDDVYEVIADVYRKVAQDLGVKPHQVQGVTWQTWRVMKDEWNAKSNDWVKGRGPFMLPEPDGSDNMVWRTLLGEPNPGVRDIYSAMPDRVVFVTGGTGGGVFVNPDGSAGVAMRHSPDAAEQFPRLYPAATREDGVSLYSKGRARQVQDVNQLRAQIAEQVGGNHMADVESVAAWGGIHPAMANARTIVFEVPQEGGKLPSFLRQDRLAAAGEPILADVPAPPPGGLRAATMEEFLQARRYLNEGTERKGETTVDKMLSKIPDNPSEEWAGHRFWLTEDGKAGYALSKDGDLQQVFNTSGVRGFGGQMVEHAKTQGAKTLDFYDGQFLDDGSIGPGYLGKFYEKHGFKESWSDDWNPEYDAPLFRPTGPRIVGMELPEEAVVQPARQTGPVTRYAYAPSEAEWSKLDKMLVDLEAAGVRIHGVYGPGRPPAGWKAAREHVFEDGVNRLVVRTADPETISAHGFPVWVKDVDHAQLPTKNPFGQRHAPKLVTRTQADGRVMYSGLATGDVDILGKGVRAFEINFDGPVPVITNRPDFLPGGLAGDNSTEFGNGVVRKIGDRFVIDAVDPSDITREVMAYDLLGSMGVPPEKIDMNIGASAVAAVKDPRGRRLSGTTSFGVRVEQPRMTGTPVAAWRDRGIWFDEASRQPTTGKIVRMAEEHHAPLQAAFDRFAADPTHAEMMRLMKFTRIMVAFDQASAKEAAYGWYVPEVGGAIALSGHYITEPGKLAATLGIERLDGMHNPMLPNDAGGLLAHELGHVMHDAVLRSFKTKGEANTFNAELRKIFNRLGAENVRTEVSVYGSQNLDEFVAETLAEAWYGTTVRPVAAEVYATVMDQFRANVAPIRRSWSGWDVG